MAGGSGSPRCLIFQGSEAGCLSAEALAEAGSLHALHFPDLGNIFSKPWKKVDEKFQGLENQGLVFSKHWKSEFSLIRACATGAGGYDVRL